MFTVLTDFYNYSLRSTINSKIGDLILFHMMDAA